MLETMLMQSMAICYNYENGRLDQKEVGSKIGELKTRNYNEALVGVVENMLTIDPKRRPSILELE